MMAKLFRLLGITVDVLFDLNLKPKFMFLFCYLLFKIITKNYAWARDINST